jgi:hypothetical protein
MSAFTASIVTIYPTSILIGPNECRLSPRPLLDLLGSNWGVIFRFVQCQERFLKSPHRSDRFQCGRHDVVFPRHTIIGVTEYHRCDGFPHADPLKVCCEAFSAQNGER